MSCSLKVSSARLAAGRRGPQAHGVCRAYSHDRLRVPLVPQYAAVPSRRSMRAAVAVLDGVLVVEPTAPSAQELVSAEGVLQESL